MDRIPQVEIQIQSLHPVDGPDYRQTYSGADGRVEFGLLGHYNKYKKSPFETFDVGGDGMTGYSSYATESIALRGYENSSLTPYGSEGYAYTRLGLELRYPLMLETSTSIYALTFCGSR